MNELFTTPAPGDNPIFLTGNQTSRVASLDVEGGSYLVLGTAVIGNLSSYKVDAVCLLQPSSSETFPLGQVWLLESERSTGNIATAMVAIQMISSFSGPFTVVMDCTIPTPGGEGFVQYGRLSALKVEVLHTQN